MNMIIIKNKKYSAKESEESGGEENSIKKNLKEKKRILNTVNKLFFIKVWKRNKKQIFPKYCYCEYYGKNSW